MCKFHENEHTPMCHHIPCMPPTEQPCMPPQATTHAPLGATMHAPPEQPHTHPPEQPCMPPQSNHARCPPSVNRMTNWCKNITLPQTSFAGGNNIRLTQHTSHRINITLSNLSLNSADFNFQYNSLEFSLKSAHFPGKMGK